MLSYQKLDVYQSNRRSSESYLVNLDADVAVVVDVDVNGVNPVLTVRIFAGEKKIQG